MECLGTWFCVFEFSFLEHLCVWVFMFGGSDALVDRYGEVLLLLLLL